MFTTIKNGHFVAGEDLSAKQFHQVKLSSGKLVACTVAGEVGCGVLQNAPASGEACEIIQYGETQIVVSGTIAENAPFGTNNAGKAVALAYGTDTTKFVHGRIIDAVTGSPGALRQTRAFVDFCAPHRAA